MLKPGTVVRCRNVIPTVLYSETGTNEDVFETGRLGAHELGLVVAYHVDMTDDRVSEVLVLSSNGDLGWTYINRFTEEFNELGELVFQETS